MQCRDLPHAPVRAPGQCPAPCSTHRAHFDQWRLSPLHIRWRALFFQGSISLGQTLLCFLTLREVLIPMKKPKLHLALLPKTMDGQVVAFGEVGGAGWGQKLSPLGSSALWTSPEGPHVGKRFPSTSPAPSPALCLREHTVQPPGQDPQPHTLLTSTSPRGHVTTPTFTFSLQKTQATHCCLLALLCVYQTQKCLHEAPGLGHLWDHCTTSRGQHHSHLPSHHTNSSTSSAQQDPPSHPSGAPSGPASLSDTCCRQQPAGSLSDQQPDHISPRLHGTFPCLMAGHCMGISSTHTNINLSMDKVPLAVPDTASMGARGSESQATPY